jgi:signal transduction histidine kinase
MTRAESNAMIAVRGLAHDLRQPVAAIVALASAAAAEPRVSKRVRERMDQIAAEARWIGQLIEEALADRDSQPGTGMTDVAALVREAVVSAQRTYPGRVSLCQVGAGPALVAVSATGLRRAIGNVLANATRAAGTDGCVHVTQRRSGPSEVVEIEDDGPGFGLIPAGHGIGLAVTRAALAECGGHLESERLPTGRTQIRLVLPAPRTAGAD